MTRQSETASIKSLIALCAILLLAMGALGFYRGEGIKYSVQEKILDLVITLASFIFGVMGAWLALLYPEVLKDINNNNPSQKSAQPTLYRVFIPMFLAVFVIAIGLIAKLGAVVIHSFDLSQKHIYFFREISFSLIAVCSGLVIVALLFAIAPALQMMLDQKASRAVKRSDEHMFRDSHM